MLSTPLICCSIGATTVVATTSALAPGYCPETVIVGGAISGYCATGSRVKATTPRITMTIDTTEAKIGRSMKKCEMRMACADRYFDDCCIGAAGAPGAAGGAPCSCGRTFLPAPRQHPPAHHHPCVGLG